MKHIQIKRSGLFKPLLRSSSVQAATMVLRPGQSSSEQPEDEHPKAEQWLFVLSGGGRARVAGRTIRLRAGTLLLIEKREPHRITNTGSVPMVTLNFYAPPAYRDDGNVMPSVTK